MRSGHNPPRLAVRLFTWYCGTAMVDDLLGDMDEIFRKNLSRMPAWRAKMKYWLQVFSLITSYAIKKRRQRASLHPHSNSSINIHMLKNYFLIAWRMMVRNQVYTVINVLGLTLGISACIIVYLVVSHEMSFDKFHPDTERIYRLKAADLENGFVCPCVPAPVYPSISDTYAGAEAFAGAHWYSAKATIDDNGKQKTFDRNTVDAILTNPDYFKIFQYQWLAGNPGNMSKPSQVVLTETRARTYFGSTNLEGILGKTIAYNDSLIVTVAGVVKDWEENSDFKHSEFISFSTVENSFLKDLIFLNNWGIMMSSSQSFIKIRPDDKPGEVAEQLSQISGRDSKQRIGIELEALPEIHLNYGGRNNQDLRSTLFTLSGLAAFILIIAAINFINLSTAQSIGRSREIGIRKVIGSLKRQIVVQFLSETIVLAFVSLCLSLALVRPLLFLFSDFVPAGITFDPLSPNNWLFMGGLLLVISVLAGAYPALVMSSFRPAIVLAGKITAVRGSFSLRKTLIVFQFSFSLFFIIATLVISSQMNYIRNADRGFSTTSVLTINTNWRSDVRKVAALAERIRSISAVEDVATQALAPMGLGQSGATFEYTGKKEKVEGDTFIKAGDQYFIPLYKMRLLAGRNLQPSDTLKEIVINEAFVKRLGFDDPQDVIGEKIKFHGKSYPVCGVVQDFHQSSFRNAIAPCLIGTLERELHSIAVRLPQADVMANADLILRIESEFKQIFPDEPFDYHFIEDEIGQMHDEEQKTSDLAAIAMFVTIFISCMGVFGLAMFTAAMRTREIGIRKVLGATSFSIVNMLSREFMVLIIIAIVLATPVAWYYMNNWLLEFTYHADLDIWFFVGAAGIALITGLATVSMQSFKAASGDPARALRTE